MGVTGYDHLTDKWLTIHSSVATINPLHTHISQDVLPLLLTCLQHVRNVEQRDGFLHCLLFLNKRPDDSQRVNISTTLLLLLLPSLSHSSSLDISSVEPLCIKLLRSKTHRAASLGRSVLPCPPPWTVDVCRGLGGKGAH